MSINRTTNMKSRATSTPIPLDPERRYLMIVATTDLTLSISGGPSFVIPGGQAWEPAIAPMNSIAFSAGSGVWTEG
jgi:hypothetical protein